MATFKELKAKITDPDVKAYLDSYQYKLSLDILGTRVSKNYSDFQAAQLVGLSYSDYLKLEHGDIHANFTKADYQHILKTLKGLPDNHDHPEIWVAKAESPDETSETYFHTQHDASEYLAAKYPLPTSFIPQVPIDPADIQLDKVYCDVTEKFSESQGLYRLVIYRHSTRKSNQERATTQDLEKLQLELPLETYVYQIGYYD